MQRRIIDSIAPGAILSMAEFYKAGIFFYLPLIDFTSHFKPSRIAQTENSKSIAQWATISLRSKFTNDFIPVPISPMGLTFFT